LLTHEDAIANIKLADASKQLAQSMKKDSSAMKTVAIMTMAFLPATFFAALFAVLSLQWDKPGVVQDKFWIYWAFTLPSTAFVFIAWFLITNWESITSGKNGRE
jgi:FtsH-binding integral membrane protein